MYTYMIPCGIFNQIWVAQKCLLSDLTSLLPTNHKVHFLFPFYHNHHHSAVPAMQLRFQPPTDLLRESLSHSLATSPATSSYFSSGSLSPDEDSYFGRKYVRSPTTFSDLEDDEGNDSDSTLDDADFLNKFGSPLERIPPREGQDGAIAVIAVGADHEAVHEIIYHRGIPCSSNCPSPTPSSESSMTSSITCVCFFRYLVPAPCSDF
jgi:hypothetical protein